MQIIFLLKNTQSHHQKTAVRHNVANFFCSLGWLMGRTKSACLRLTTYKVHFHIILFAVFFSKQSPMAHSPTGRRLFLFRQFDVSAFSVVSAGGRGADGVSLCRQRGEYISRRYVTFLCMAASAKGFNCCYCWELDFSWRAPGYFA